VIPAKAEDDKPKQRAKNEAPPAPKASTTTVQVNVQLDESVTAALGVDDEEVEVARAAVAAHRSAKQQAFFATHPQARAAAPPRPGASRKAKPSETKQGKQRQRSSRPRKEPNHVA